MTRGSAVIVYQNNHTVRKVKQIEVFWVFDDIAAMVYKIEIHFYLLQDDSALKFPFFVKPNPS